MTINKTNLIDTHSHLNFEKFDSDREEVIQKCKEKLKAVVISGARFDSNKESLELSEKHSGFIFPTLGLHPIHSDENIEKVKEQINENLEKIIGIGEIGLDYYHSKEKEERDYQKEIFREMLDLVEKTEKPAVIHSRDAEKDTLNILEEKGIENAILHCFNGNLERARRGCERGYFVSISTQVLYSKRVKELAEKLPLDKILLETDSPYLYRGERNVPWNIKESLETISELREVSENKLAGRIYKNTMNAFPDLKKSLE